MFFGIISNPIHTVAVKLEIRGAGQFLSHKPSGVEFATYLHPENRYALNKKCGRHAPPLVLAAPWVGDLVEAEFAQLTFSNYYHG